MASLLTSVSSAASVSAVPVSAACVVSSAAAAVSAAGVCVDVPPHAVSVNTVEALLQRVPMTGYCQRLRQLSNTKPPRRAVSIYS